MKRIRIAIVGNCQAGALAACLARTREFQVCSICDLNLSETAQFGHSRHAIVHERDFDFVLTQNIGDQFAELSTARLKELYGDRCRTFTNLYFTGLHPDITYVGGFGSRLSSPVGDYHSRIALIGYLNGLSADETCCLYNDEVFAALGFYEQFEQSGHELMRRDDSIDIRIGLHFLSKLTVLPSLYSINHPTVTAIMLLADAVMRDLYGGTLDTDCNVYPDSLVKNVIWPIYPDIAVRHRVSYRSPFMFFPADCHGSAPLSLEEFVAASYVAYDGVGVNELLQSPQLRELMSDNPLSRRAASSDLGGWRSYAYD